MNNKNKSISFVIPAYNEELGIVKTLKSIPLNKLKQQNYQTEVIIVNNNSNDKTVELASNFGANVIHESKQGYGAAYKRGLAYASGNILICGDCDTTYPFELVPQLLEIMDNEKLDFITTNRFPAGFFNQKNMPLMNQFGNLLLTIEAKILYGVQINDVMSGMWLVKKSVLKNISLISNGMSFSHEIKIKLIKSGECSWKEITIPYDKRLGTSKLKVFSDGIPTIINLFKYRFK